MAMFRTVSKVGEDGVRYKERVAYTAQEEVDRLVEESASVLAQANKEAARKRDKLIAYEKNRILEEQVATQRTDIEKMNDNALDAALISKGLK